jgi:hypothetical protein
MNTAPAMQRTITELARRFGVDVSQPGAYLRLELGGYMPLSIECTGPHQVAVAHSFVQEGDLMVDPEIVFFTGYKAWVPVEITQAPLGLYRRYATLNLEASAIAAFIPEGVAEVARFANHWAKKLQAQGWLDQARQRS